MTIERPMFPPPVAARNCSSKEQFLEPSRPLATLDASIEAASTRENRHDVATITSSPVVMLDQTATAVVCSPEKVRPADFFGSASPAHSKRKTSEQVVFSQNNGSDREPLSRPAETGRRGFLRGLAALLPLTAVTAQIAPVPAAANPLAEDPDLLRLGDEIAALTRLLVDAVVDREEARARCRAQWPLLPEDIVWRRSQHDGFDYEHETDEDHKIAHPDPKRAARLIITVLSLVEFSVGDGRFRLVKLARKLQPLAIGYQNACAAARHDSGFQAAKQRASGLAYQIEERSDAVSKFDCRTFRGLSVKALALQASIFAGEEVDHHIGFRAKVLHAEIMARDVLKLTKAA